MATKEQLVEMIRFGHGEVVRFTERLSETDRNTIGEGDHWTVRDALSHVIETLNQDVQRWSSLARGEVFDDGEDFNITNARMVADYRQRTWEDMLAVLAASRPAFEAIVAPRTDEEINDPDRYPQLQGRPFWRALTATMMIHPLASHIRPWLIANGERADALQQAQEEARLALAMDSSPDWRANVTYNLACTHALLGEKETALKQLEEAFRLSPRYARFAPDDSDLVSLHGTPEFDALLASAAEPQ